MLKIHNNWLKDVAYILWIVGSLSHYKSERSQILGTHWLISCSGCWETSFTCERAERERSREHTASEVRKRCVSVKFILLRPHATVDSFSAQFIPFILPFIRPVYYFYDVFEPPRLFLGPYAHKVAAPHHGLSQGCTSKTEHSRQPWATRERITTNPSCFASILQKRHFTASLNCIICFWQWNHFIY